MIRTFSERIQALDSLDSLTSLQGIKRGLEKESLRVDKNGDLAYSDHPAALGSSLTHPFITTDYSEALLEFITPPLNDLNGIFETLSDIHQYTYRVLKDELLWMASMPCFLPSEEEIPIAKYGRSNLGMLKQIYRRGLGYRYGRVMQTIAGVHYNFSLPNIFWEKYKALLGSEQPEKEFISEQYLAISRNVLRFGWLLSLLMGASPAISTSFFKQKKTTLKEWRKDTLIGAYATSLRLSDLGYHNKIQSRCSISYNSFSEFLQSMKKAVHTPAAEYQRMGIIRDGEYIQLSDKIFQIEDEHYALVRPKRVAALEERTLSAISREGIEYLEVRALDVNPFSPIGVEKEMIYFLDAFLITCLLMESPSITDEENKVILYNHSQVVREGLRPEVTLMQRSGKSCTLMDFSLDLLGKIQPVAELLNKAYLSNVFTDACQMANRRILSQEILPAAKVLQEMRDKKESYLEFVWRHSLAHQRYFFDKEMDPAKFAFYQKTAMDSIKEQEKIEKEDTLSFEEYLKNYLAN